MSLGARRRRPPTPGFVANDLWRRAGAVPSFHIAPARTQNARDLITGSVLGTYNSASPALAVGPDGVLFQPAANAPVIEHDPVTLSCLGARIWGAVTNLLLRSEDFGNAIWFNQGTAPTVSVNAAIAPDGTSTADRITFAAGDSRRQQTFTTTNGATYTFSVYVKAVSSSLNQMRLAIYDGVFQLNSTDFTVSNTQWQRISFTVTSSSSSNFANVQIRNSLSNALANDIYVWGAQLQTGSTLGPYVPTTTTAASSTADVWDLTSLTAGINNLKTIYFRGRTAASGTRGIASLNDNSSSNRLELSTSGTDPKATAVTSGSTVADLNGGTIAANSTFRLAARFDTDSYALSLNGGAVTTDTSGARALVDRLFIGRDQAGNYQNGYLEEMAGWTKSCTDAQIAALAAS